jgi:hypothetical protein
MITSGKNVRVARYAFQAEKTQFAKNRQRKEQNIVQRNPYCQETKQAKNGSPIELPNVLHEEAQ